MIKERLDEVDQSGGFAVDGDGEAVERKVDPATVDALFEETRRAAQSARSAFGLGRTSATTTGPRISPRPRTV